MPLIPWHERRAGRVLPSVPGDQHGTNQTNMVMKRDKNEGAKKTAATAAPKARAASKPKAASRIPAAEPVVKAAKTAKPAKKKIATASTVRQEDIAFRAYLIAEKRQQLGLPGDSLGDWVEAERQLLSERGTHGVN